MGQPPKSTIFRGGSGIFPNHSTGTLQKVCKFTKDKEGAHKWDIKGSPLPHSSTSGLALVSKPSRIGTPSRGLFAHFVSFFMFKWCLSFGLHSLSPSFSLPFLLLPFFTKEDTFTSHILYVPDLGFHSLSVKELFKLGLGDENHSLVPESRLGEGDEEHGVCKLTDYSSLSCFFFHRQLTACPF